jgi:hypothetical protein
MVTGEVVHVDGGVHAMGGPVAPGAAPVSERPEPATD